jgi:hypothetical protein
VSLRHPLLRRSILFGGPFLVYLAGLVHPHSLRVGEETTRFVAVHLLLPALVCLLAGALWLLVDGVEGRAASLARVLVLPFAVAYTVFTTYDGIAVGMFVRKAGELPAVEQPAADALIGLVSQGRLADVLWLVAIGFWLATVAAIVVALRERAPWPALVLMAVGAAAFARSHVSPWGPAGMAAFFAGVVWLDVRPRRARVSSYTPTGYDCDDGRGRPDSP